MERELKYPRRINVTESTFERLKDVALRERRTVSNLVCLMMEEEIEGIEDVQHLKKVKSISVRIPPSLRAKIQLLAEAMDVSQYDLIEAALEKGLEARSAMVR